eukprot:TRINITY_DN78009_c0_g1_i1.p1 TRINITY_DN78009_c0_g1~~TRINITY_DN78009_c0_g1_i1.p1  ORF type:complete len:269 (-),score=28.53 TRINITY_DN78009_c0_g1_i1:209-1015(-)
MKSTASKLWRTATCMATPPIAHRKKLTYQYQRSLDPGLSLIPGFGVWRTFSTKERLRRGPTMVQDDNTADESQAPEKRDRWSREIRSSPGGNPAGMWREASRIGQHSMPSMLGAASKGAGVFTTEGSDKVLSFGKYASLTYGEVLRRDPGYCEKIVLRADGGDMDEEYMDFAAYLRRAAAAPLEVRTDDLEVERNHSTHAEAAGIRLSSKTLETGKYAGYTYAEILEMDLEYCKWLVENMMESGKDASPYWPFVAYILYCRNNTRGTT